MTMSDQRCYRLQVGPVSIELRCESPQYARSLADYFGRPSAPGAPDISLELEIVSHADIPDIPNSLVAGKSVSGHEFTIADGLITGNFDPRSRRGKLSILNILTKGQYPRVFEQVLYQAVQSAFRTAGTDALMIHSSAVATDQGGFLFVGASGTGKSTVAELSADFAVLNDEMNLVSFDNDPVELHGTPFNGFYQGKVEGTAPLRAVFLLAHGRRHELAPVGPAEAVSILSAQICPPVGLEDPFSPDIRLQMLDLAEKLFHSVPVQRLEFTPDPGFWDLIFTRFGKVPD